MRFRGVRLGPAWRAVAFLLLLWGVTHAGLPATADTCARTAEETGRIDPAAVCALEQAGWTWLGFRADGSGAHLFEDMAGNEIDVLSGSFDIVQNRSQMVQTIYDLAPGPKTVRADRGGWDLLAVMLGDRSDPKAVAAFEAAGISLPETGYVALAPEGPEDATRLADLLDDLVAGNKVMLDQQALVAALTGANVYAIGCGITPTDPLRGVLRAFNTSASDGMSFAGSYTRQARAAIAAAENHGLPGCSARRGVAYLNALSDSLGPSFRALSDRPFLQGCRGGNRMSHCRCAFAALALYHDDLAETRFSGALFGRRAGSFRGVGVGTC